MIAYEQEWDKAITCYFVRAEHFPHDAKASHQTLHSKITFDPGRLYLGLSKFKPDGSLEYLAACTEIQEGELKDSGLKSLSIPAASYLCTDLEDYMQKIDQIGDIFGALIKDKRFNPEAWSIELYKPSTCICMIPLISSDKK